MFLKHSLKVYAGALLLGLLAVCPPLTSQPAPQPAETAQSSQAPVALQGKVIFSVRGILSFTAEARAAAIERRIGDLSKDVTFKPQSISVADAEGTSDIMAGDLVLMSVTDQDASAAGVARPDLARDYAQRISAALIAFHHAYSLKSLILGGVYAIISTLVLILVLRLPIWDCPTFACPFLLRPRILSLPTFCVGLIPR